MAGGFLAKNFRNVCCLKGAMCGNWEVDDKELLRSDGSRVG
jgi:hypothetical protein